MTKENIEAVRSYLMDLECPIPEDDANEVCDLALKALRPEDGATEQREYVERLKRLHNWIIVTRPYLLDEFASSGFYDSLEPQKGDVPK